MGLLWINSRVGNVTESNNYSNQADIQAFVSCFAKDYMKEQKRKRLWRWVTRFFMFSFIVVIAYQVISLRGHGVASRNADHVGLIDISGTIADSENVNAENFVKSLDKAYESRGLKALILRINSPGGSPVQADYMFNALRFFHDKHPDIKTYAVCVDMCASAAYYIAAGTDEIYANESSIVGSIGVLYNGFGFVDTLNKVGASRRLLTAGKNKGFMDPFSPINEDQEKKMGTMLDIIHQQFIAKVKAGRGKRLVINDEIFSGLFWTGVQAKEMGLIDGFASSGQLAREKIKVEKFVDYSYKETVIEKVAKKIGAAAASKLPESLGIKPEFR